jgi:outer membrane lipoprotein SlyB
MNLTRFCSGALSAALLTGALTLAPYAHAQSRAGIIEELQPIENRGEDTSERTKAGRTWGERIGKFGGLAAGVGLTRAGHTEAGLAVTGAAAIGGDKVGGAVGERIAGEGPATRYMVKVRLDEGRVLSLTQLREEIDGLGIGSRVVVEGSGDEAKLQALR